MINGYTLYGTKGLSKISINRKWKTRFELIFWLFPKEMLLTERGNVLVRVEQVSN